MNNKYMKVAIATNNGETVGGDFGTSKFFEVITIINGKVVGRERREKFVLKKHKAKRVLSLGVPGDGNWDGLKEDFFKEDENIPRNSADRIDKMKMAEPILDCQMVISRAMGFGVYNKFKMMNIKPYITNIKTISDAVKAIIDGKLVDHNERMH